MKKEDILTILSDININSETAGDAIELYIKFMYFETIIDFLICFCFVGIVVAFGCFVTKLLKEASE